MKVNGYILTYPLGYTNIDSGSDDSEAMEAIEALKEQLTQDLNQLDTKNLDVSEFESRIEELTNGLEDLLKMKADLIQTAGQETPDDPSDDEFKVKPEQLPEDEDDSMDWIDG